jgi:hypothetical protein
VEYAPDGADLSDELTAPSVDSVLGKLVLRLERARGPREFLVIDHVEEPSENRLGQFLESRRGPLFPGEGFLPLHSFGGIWSGSRKRAIS